MSPNLPSSLGFLSSKGGMLSLHCFNGLIVDVSGFSIHFIPQLEFMLIFFEEKKRKEKKRKEKKFEESELAVP